MPITDTSSSSSLGILPDAAVSLTVGGHMASHILFSPQPPRVCPESQVDRRLQG